MRAEERLETVVVRRLPVVDPQASCAMLDQAAEGGRLTEAKSDAVRPADLVLTGRPVAPVVARRPIIPEALGLARARGVWRLLDGQAPPPGEACRLPGRSPRPPGYGNRLVRTMAPLSCSAMASLTASKGTLRPTMRWKGYLWRARLSRLRAS